MAFTSKHGCRLDWWTSSARAHPRTPYPTALAVLITSSWIAGLFSITRKICKCFCFLPHKLLEKEQQLKSISYREEKRKGKRKEKKCVNIPKHYFSHVCENSLRAFHCSVNTLSPSKPDWTWKWLMWSAFIYTLKKRVNNRLSHRLGVHRGDLQLLGEHFWCCFVFLSNTPCRK